VARLSDEQIARELATLPEWTRSENEIVRTIRFPSFMAAIGFVNRVAELAEAADHHPDLDIRYRNVRLALSTHDEGGLTERDFKLAGQIDEAAR